jgi:copper oxidase (laccase) domain-containing protein
MKIQFFSPAEIWPKCFIAPVQTHSANICEIKTGAENLQNCDGIFTAKKNLILAIRTADCAAVCFCDRRKIGIAHAGWRGAAAGILGKMATEFRNPEIFVAPFLPRFEIQKDFCFEILREKFGDDFFEFENSRDLNLRNLEFQNCKNSQIQIARIFKLKIAAFEIWNLKVAKI